MQAMFTEYYKSIRTMWAFREACHGGNGAQTVSDIG